MIKKFVDEMIEDIDRLRLKLYYIRGAVAAYEEQEEGNEMNLKDCTIRQKENGIYVIRFRRDGYDKYFSSPNIQEARKKAKAFLDGLKTIKTVSDEPTKTKDKKPLLKDYATLWFETVKKPYVKNTTAGNYGRILRKYLSNELGAMQIKEVRPQHVQKLMNELKEKGHGRTAEDVYFLLKQIFEYAIANELIKNNPMNAVKRKKHIRTTGQALTIKDEYELVKACHSSKFGLIFILLLYTGVRICEVPTVVIEDKFITAENLKRKTDKREFKKIPVTPMIRPYVAGIKEINKKVRICNLEKEFKILTKGQYTPKDLRHTFITRCQTCGVQQQIVSLWAGHAVSSITGRVYTHFEDDFLYEEGQKVKYTYKDK